MGQAMLAVLVAGVAVCLLSPSAHAHKIHVFTVADGAEIRGTVYFSGGGKAEGIEVTAFDADGTILGSAITDENGEFSFTATAKADHVFKVETPDGHAASCTVSAAELPDTLPSSDEAAGPETAASAAAGQGHRAPAEADSSPAPLASQVELLRKQVTALRRQLDDFQERRSFQDILGGIGYIIGIAGVAFYVMARRERARRSG